MPSATTVLLAFCFLAIISSCEQPASHSALPEREPASNPNYIEPEVSPEMQRYVRKQVKRYANGTPYRDKILYNRGEAVAVAEPILYSVFGKESVVEQRPYFVCQVDQYWYISGTLPKSEYKKLPDGSEQLGVTLGGVWEIILDATDCRVVYLQASE